MTVQVADRPPSVDVVIPVFNEKASNLAETLSACLNQTYIVSNIFVVDDGSIQPAVLPDWALFSDHISLVRLPENRGISAARNAAIERSASPFVACVNAEVLPDRDWIATCEHYLSSHADVGACCTRVIPRRPNRLLTRWRTRFHEVGLGEQSGPVEFAPGHAVLFRRKAIDSVAGYDVRYRRNHEDSDICQRMRKVGWETHYVANSRCISTQEDSLRELAAKQLIRDTDVPDRHSFIRQVFLLSKWTLVRASRNILRGRLTLVPVDAAIWALALWISASRALSSLKATNGTFASPAIISTFKARIAPDASHKQ